MGHGKETPRQKMIGMMYLVLTAMLALNVSADILNAFVLVDNGLVKTTASFVAKNESAYGVFEAQMEKSRQKVEPFRNKAFSVKDMADELAYYIQELKVEIVKYCDGDNAPALVKPVEWLIGEKREKKSTYEIDDALIKSKDNLDKAGEIMIVKKKGEDLKEKIEAYREHLLSLTDNPSVQQGIRESLNTDPMTDTNGTSLNWEEGHFEHIPMVAAITMLSKIQSDVRNAEADIINNLLAQIGASDTKVNKMEAIIKPKSNYVMKGGEFEAQIILAAYDSLQKPTIMLGPYRRTAAGLEMVGEGRELKYDAKAIYRSAATTVGNFTVQGLLQVLAPDGTTNSYPFNTEYQVGEPQAVISATKMNVLYVGVDNPISIVAAGVPASAVTARMTNGTLDKSGNDWIARPTTPGTKAIVTVTAKVDGKDQKMGEMEYRVKSVPNPTPTVGGSTGGKIAKATLAMQLAVVADMGKDFDFDLKFTVTGYSVTIVKGGNARSFDNKEARFSQEIKQQFEGLTKGSKVFIEEIKAVGPDRRTRELSAINFTIE